MAMFSIPLRGVIAGAGGCVVPCLSCRLLTGFEIQRIDLASRGSVSAIDRLFSRELVYVYYPGQSFLYRGGVYIWCRF